MKQFHVACCIGLFCISISCSKHDAKPSPAPPVIDSVTVPTMSANAVVYVMYNNARLFALDATNGTTKWTSRINNNWYSDGLSATPALVSGILYNGSTDSAIYAIDASTGVQKWRVPIDRNPFAPCSPLVKNNILYYAAYDTVFYALNIVTGQQVWRRKFPREFDYSPVIENDVLYMVNNGGIYALDATTGSTLWSYTPGSGYFLNGPTVRNGVLYAWTYTPFGSGSRLQLFNAANGNSLPGRIGYGVSYNMLASRPLVPDDSTAYITCSDSCLYSTFTYNIFGRNTLTWKFKADAPLYSSVTADTSALFFSSVDGTVYSVNRSDGKMRWSYRTNSPKSNHTNGAPVIANGVIYFDSEDGTYAINAKTGKKIWYVSQSGFLGATPLVLAVNGQVFNTP